MGENSSQSQITMEYPPVGRVQLSYDLLTRKNQEPVSSAKMEQTPNDSPTEMSRKTADEKAARMLDRFDKEHFNRIQDIRRMRLHLLSLVIRNKIKDSLKRVLDLIVVIPGMFIAVPVSILIAIAIKIDSPGPIFFEQERVGKWGKPFNLYKFRSMDVNAEALLDELMAQNDADEVMFKMKEDPRVTRVGRFLRKTSLDEVPQIFNVLKGDMSMVGPRPPVPDEVEQYQYDYLRRLDVLPGITGLPQISGRSDLPFRRWIELDIQYIEERSLWKDIVIMARTIPTMIFGKGAY
ncbi:MAG: exopolysaccharide biosynthesis polyprenyl glycosylphosphotransferase [Candidatus Promineifilaceae bacterium]